jgi:hypothetical protein
MRYPPDRARTPEPRPGPHARPKAAREETVGAVVASRPKPALHRLRSVHELLHARRDADVEAFEQVAPVAEDVAHVRVRNAVQAALEAREVERGRDVVARVVAVARHQVVERPDSTPPDEHGEDHLVGDDDVPRRGLLGVRPLGLRPEVGQEAELNSTSIPVSPAKRETVRSTSRKYETSSLRRRIRSVTRRFPAQPAAADRPPPARPRSRASDRGWPCQAHSHFHRPARRASRISASCVLSKAGCGERADRGAGIGPPFAVCPRSRVAVAGRAAMPIETERRGVVP